MNYKKIGNALLVCSIIVSMMLIPNTKVLAGNNEPDIGITEEETDMDDVSLGGNTGTPTTPTTTEGTGGNELTDWTYTETDTTITLTKYIGAKMDIEIPSVLGRKEVKINPGTTEVGRTGFFPTTVTSIVIPDTTNKVEYENTTLSLFFTGKTSLVKADLRGLDTSQVTDMSQSISRNNKLQELNITGWNTSNVTKANSMFANLTVLPRIEGLNTLDTSQIQNMESMFEGCTWMTTIDVSKFNTSSATSIANMFMNCANVKEIDVSKFDTKNVENMAGIVQGCSNLVTFDVSNFQTSKVWSFARMFQQAEKLEVVDLSKFDTSSLTQMGHMFHGCSSIESLDFSNFNTSKVNDATTMFADCKSLTNLDLSSFVFSLPVDFRDIFNGCSSLINLEMPNFGANKVVFMKQMFANTNSLQVFDLSGYTLDKLQDSANGTDNLFTIADTTAKVPTVIITSSTLLKTKFDTTITGRTYGGPFYNANGGTFAGSKTTEQYFDHFVFTDKSEFTVTKQDVANKYTPTNTEATFKGWYVDAQCTTPFVADTTTLDLTTPEYLNLQLYAGWQYKVTYDVNGGTAVPQENYIGGNLITKPTDPTKTGYDFVGWYKESTYDNAWNFASDKVSKDTTLYAKWDAKTWNITFDEKGGTPVDDTTAKTDASIQSPTPPTREGYDFVGWYKESTCDNAWDFTNDKVSKDTTLYAKWDAKTWNITFDEKGGTPVNDTTAKTDALIQSPTPPTKSGYDFVGWYRESTCVNAWNFTNDKVSKDTTLYAKWEAKTWNITFEEDGGSAVNDTTAKTDGYIEEPGETSKGGYSFMGWFKEVLCKTLWKFDTDKVYGDTTLYAGWGYAVSYNVHNGTPVASKAYMSGSLIERPTDPTRAGYDFAGWYKENTYNNEWIFTSDTITANTELHAKWNAKTWNITFEENGGTTLADITAKTDELITFPTPPTKKGYTLGGWYTDASLNTPWNAATDTVKTHTTLYAKWIGNTHTLTLESGNRQNDVVQKGIIYGDVYGNLPTPINDGATFAGWYTQKAGKGEKRQESDIVNIDADQILYGYWVNDYFENTDGNIKFENKQDARYSLKIDKVNQESIKNKEGLQSVYDIYFVLNDNRMSVQNKNMTVTINLKENEIGFSHYRVVYVNEKGEAVEEYVPRLLDSKDALQFEISHLSVYAVYAWNDETPKGATIENTTLPSQDNVNNSKNPDTGDSTESFVSLYAILVILSFTVAAFTLKTRDNKKESGR